MDKPDDIPASPPPMDNPLMDNNLAMNMLNDSSSSRPQSKASALDAAALLSFTAALSNLPKDEIVKAKKLYILNAIADFDAQRASQKAGLITLGIMCIFPLFLIVFIPALYCYQKSIAAGKQKILNAIDVWKDDLGADYLEIRSRIA